MKKILFIITILLISINVFALSIDEFCNLCENNKIKEVEKHINEININTLNSNGSSPLVSAIKSNNVKMVELILSKGADTNLKEENGSSPLLEALRNDNIDIINLLINSGADVNYSDINGTTPLLRTVANFNELLLGNDEILYIKPENPKAKPYKLNKRQQEFQKKVLNIINLLLDKGADVYHCNKQGNCPIIQSILDDNLVIFDNFVKKGFDINSFIGLQETTPLNFSIMEKKPLFVTYLCEKKVDINKKDKSGFSPIYISVISGNLDLLTYLYENGADINSVINNTNDYPITEACKMGKIDIIKFLIKNNCDINVRDNNGFTPVHDSVLHSDILEIILENNVNINARNNYLETPLHLAVKYNKKASCELLVNKGAVLTKDINSKTPLDIAKEKNLQELIPILEKANTDIIVPDFFLPIKDNNIDYVKEHCKELLSKLDSFNNNALNCAIYFNRNEIFDILINEGININSVNHSNMTPLKIAVTLNNTDFVNKLLEKGADPNINDIENESPLMTAIEKNNINIVNALIEKGANVNNINHKSQSVLDYAYYEGNSDIINILLNKGADFKYKDNEGNLPVYYILTSKNIESKKANFINYLQLNNDLNYTNLNKETLLITACKENLGKDIIEMLINDNNINEKDISGYNALVYCFDKGNIENVKLLLEKGAKYSTGKRINLLNICLSKNYNEELFKLALDIEKNINDNKIETPLNIAIDNQNITAINLLLEKGADVNVKGKEYPLIKSLLSKNNEIINLILSKNPKTDIVWKYKLSPLHIAVKYNDFNVVKKLIDIGADVNATSEQGWCPIHLVIFNEGEDKTKILNCLIENKADVNSKSTQGLTPIRNSCSMNDVEITKILKENGGNEKLPSKLQITGIDVAKDRGYIEILNLFNEKAPNTKEGFDTNIYKFMIKNINPSLYLYIKEILEAYLINCILDFSYEDNNIIINAKSPYVIGELNSIFGKIETKEFILIKTSNKDKSFDITCELKIK